MAEEATHAIDQMATASRAASMTSVQSAHTALTGLSIRSYRSGRVTKRTPGMSMRVLRAVGLAAKAETESVALVIGSGHLGTFLACQLAEVILPHDAPPRGARGRRSAADAPCPGTP
jgi:hypothetical protein